MNNPNTQLKDLIHIERGLIPTNLCDYIVDEIEKKEWRPHSWYNNVQGTFGSEETKELEQAIKGLEVYLKNFGSVKEHSAFTEWQNLKVAIKGLKALLK